LIVEGQRLLQVVVKLIGLISGDLDADGLADVAEEAGLEAHAGEAGQFLDFGEVVGEAGGGDLFDFIVDKFGSVGKTGRCGQTVEAHKELGGVEKIPNLEALNFVGEKHVVHFEGLARFVLLSSLLLAILLLLLLLLFLGQRNINICCGGISFLFSNNVGNYSLGVFSEVGLKGVVFVAESL
jgi:hypothetical protein